MDYDELFKRKEFSSALASSGYTHGRELIIYKEKDQGSTVAVGFKTQGRSILTKPNTQKSLKIQVRSQLWLPKHQTALLAQDIPLFRRSMNTI